MTKWIGKAIRHPGALHRALGVPEGQNIPASKKKVHKGDNPRLVRMKILANTLKKINMNR